MSGSGDHLTMEEALTIPQEFKLKNGLTMELRDWTLYDEMWVKKQFGDYGVLYEKIFNTQDPDAMCIESALTVIAHLLKEDSLAKLREFRNKDENDWVTLAKMMSSKEIGIAIAALYKAVIDSIPIDIIKKKVSEMRIPMMKRKKLMNTPPSQIGR